MKAWEYAKVIRQLPLALCYADISTDVCTFFADLADFIHLSEHPECSESILCAIEMKGNKLAATAKQIFTRYNEQESFRKGHATNDILNTY